MNVGMSVRAARRRPGVAFVTQPGTTSPAENFDGSASSENV
jgi:hypothetical protein